MAFGLFVLVRDAIHPAWQNAGIDLLALSLTTIGACTVDWNWPEAAGTLQRVKQERTIAQVGGSTTLR